MTAIKEHPILFSAPMVRAILEDRKTVTRRAVKGSGLNFLADFTPEYVALPENYFCPYGKPGDQLWVRETWAGPLVDEDQMHLVEMNGWDSFRKPEHCQYRASGGTAEFFDYAKDETVCRWTPSIHMPRWACRILLEITAVRVERLQDISGDQAVAEGLIWQGQESGKAFYSHAERKYPPGAHQQFGISGVDAVSAFRNLWNSVGGDWDANPWVWVVEFKRVTP